MSEITKDIISLAQKGDSASINIILNEYKSLVSSISRKYYLLGGDSEDLIQEGMIGLFKAINSFDFNKNDNFKGFAMRVVEREIISAIRRENANKNKVLDESVFIDDIDYIHEDNYPELNIISEESYKELSVEVLKNLSELERKVVKLYLRGFGYIDIAKALKKSPKAIDNALTRIKNKLRYLKERL